MAARLIALASLFLRRCETGMAAICQDPSPAGTFQPRGDFMDFRWSLASAALTAALTPAVLLAPSTPRAASSAAPLANPERPARSAPAAPAAWPIYCTGSLPAVVPPLDHGMLSDPDDHSELSLGTPGFPDETGDGALTSKTIAAGSGWHQFQMTASLPLESPDSDLADSPREMKWIVFVSTGSEKGKPNGLSTSHVQYFDGSVWSDLGQWAGASTKLVTSSFGIANSSQTATASLRLRFKIDVGAPPGLAYVVEFGSYVDADQGCTHFTFDADAITVRGPDSAPSSSRSLQYAGIGAAVMAAASAMVLVARKRKRS